MEYKEGKNGNLKIPAPVSDRDDFIQGIGTKEVSIIIAAFFAVLILAFIISGITGNLIAAVCTAAFFLGLTVITVKRDSINENLIDQVRILYRYWKTQKVFVYKHYDFFSSEGSEDNTDDSK